MIAKYLIILTIALPCFCQRPFYAGKLPIGYPEVSSKPNDSGVSRPKLPPQLKGDVDYANVLSKLPEDKQPFWFLNKKQYAEYMQHPKTYPQRPSFFNENSK